MPDQTCFGPHTASCTMGARSLPSVKWLGYGVDHPPPSGAKVEENIAVPLLPLCAFVACSRMNFAFLRS